jgi:hypothetical protein
MDRRQVYDGPGPPFFSQARFLCTEFIRGWPVRGGMFPLFFSHGGAPIGGELIGETLERRCGAIRLG